MTLAEQQTETEVAFPLFPTSEFEVRVRRAREEMEKDGVDALLLSSKQNVVYFSGLRTIGWMSNHRPVAVIVPRSENLQVTSVIPATLMDVSRKSSWIQELRPWGNRRDPAQPQNIVDAVESALKELGLQNSRIGLELGYGHRIGMAQTDLNQILARLASTDFPDASDLLWRLRMIKSPLELDALRKVCDATSKAFARGFGTIHAGMTERELAGEIMAELSLQTHETAEFVMVRSGPDKYAMVNCEAFEKRLEDGDLVVVDVGGTYKYYWSDFMRMASIGHPTSEQLRFFDAERASQQAGVDALGPGVPLAEVFGTCRRVLAEHGMDEHVPGLERVGHGVGLDMHEYPSVSSESDVVAQAGMVLTVEPIFWDLPNHNIGNFALEDIVIVTDTGHEVISHFPKDLYIVD